MITNGMKLSRTLTQLLILTVAFTFALSINYLYAAVWSGPPAGVVPPANNVNAPIHVGTAPQIKDGILEVGHSLNTSANYGLITKGRIRIDVGGIQFSDGSYQEKAAGVSGDFATGPVAQNTSVTITLTGDEKAILLYGHYGWSGDAAEAGGFLTKQGGVWRAALSASTNLANFNLTTTEQCAGTLLCVRLNASNNIIVRTTGNSQVQYMVMR